jgi:hypothetical protein
MKRNKQYLTNRAATKNPKTFNITLERNELGQFTAVGGETVMLDRSGNKEQWVSVNTRDLVGLLNKQGIIAR